MTACALVLSAAATATPPIVLDLTSRTFDDQVGRSWHTLVEFHAPWCTACASFAPVLHAVASELSRERPDMKLMRVDGDAQPELRTRFQIEEAPSLLLFPASTPAKREAAAHFAGELNRAELMNWARDTLSRLPLLSDSSPAPTAEAAKPAKSAKPAKASKQSKAATPATPATPAASEATAHELSEEAYHASELLRLLQVRAAPPPSPCSL